MKNVTLMRRVLGVLRNNPSSQKAGGLLGGELLLKALPEPSPSPSLLRAALSSLALENAVVLDDFDGDPTDLRAYAVFLGDRASTYEEELSQPRSIGLEILEQLYQHERATGNDNLMFGKLQGSLSDISESDLRLACKRLKDAEEVNTHDATGKMTYRVWILEKGRRRVEGAETKTYNEIHFHNLSHSAVAINSPLASQTVHVQNNLSSLRTALEEGTPQAQAGRARDFMDQLIDRLAKGAPDFSTSQRGEHPDDRLFRALETTRPLVKEFVDASKAMLECDAQGAILALAKRFGPLWDRYYPFETQSGRHGAFDYYRFTGYELLVLLVRSLLKEERWDVLRELLHLRIPQENEQHKHANKRHYRFHDGRKPMELFATWNERLKMSRQSWTCPEGEFIKQRYSDSAAICSFAEFSDADFFLYWCDFVYYGRSQQWRLKWCPYTAVYLGQDAPRWLRSASDPEFAEGLCLALEFSGTVQLRESLEQLKEKCNTIFPSPLDEFAPFHYVNLATIG